MFSLSVCVCLHKIKLPLLAETDSLAFFCSTLVLHSSQLSWWEYMHNSRLLHSAGIPSESPYLVGWWDVMKWRHQCSSGRDTGVSALRLQLAGSTSEFPTVRRDVVECVHGGEKQSLLWEPGQSKQRRKVNRFATENTLPPSCEMRILNKEKQYKQCSDVAQRWQTNHTQHTQIAPTWTPFAFLFCLCCTTTPTLMPPSLLSVLLLQMLDK